jgi:DNA-binding IclR family transcriptional regulator
VPESNKAKTARRVIEVLEYFDEQHPQATVMDIVRRYKRPQSSTSELLASLVEMGILYKDPASRSYTPTPRAALLGSLSQPRPVREGRVTVLVDTLSAQTGLGTALVGMVGLNAQLFRGCAGTKQRATNGATFLSHGAMGRLCDSAAGWLLLSTIAPQRREGMLRRLNAEAPAEARFSHSEMVEQIEQCGRLGYALGPAGFGSGHIMCAVLLPWDGSERPLVVGLVYDRSQRVDSDALIAALRFSVHRCIEHPYQDGEVVHLVSDAA